MINKILVSGAETNCKFITIVMTVETVMLTGSEVKVKTIELIPCSVAKLISVFRINQMLCLMLLLNYPVFYAFLTD